MSLFFEVPLQPVGKGRPRFTRHGHAYTPKTTRDFEESVAQAFRVAYPNHEPYKGAVSIEVYAFFAIPESWTKKKREAALAGEVMHTGRPDADNCLKVIEDALNGLAFNDDAQITDVSVQKRYASRPRVEVNITAWRE